MTNVPNSQSSCADPARRRVYLDHAATSWPKSPAVIAAMTDYLRDNGATASRGGYASARAAGTIADRLRHRLATVLGASSAACISFHAGCTLAINAAIESLPRSSGSWDAVVSAAEHNAVLRTAAGRCRREGGTFSIVPADANGWVDIDAVMSHVTATTRFVALTHASNVTGQIQSVAELGRRLKAENQSRDPDDRVVLLCDAAQTLGYVPVNVDELGVDLLAAPAHKGSGGPPGIALLYVAEHLHGNLQATIQGGTGHDGRSLVMPGRMPEKLEPGTFNLPAMAGWDAALASAQTEAAQTEAAQTESTPSGVTVGFPVHAIATRLHAGLSTIRGVRLVGQPGKLPIVSFRMGDALSPHEIAAILDLEFGIEVRAGHHCAGALHASLGTSDGGTVRISGGHGTSSDDLDAVVDAVHEIAASMASTC